MQAKGFDLVIASKFKARLEGFLKKQRKGCVLMITPCHDIHGLGMRLPLRYAFYSAQGMVLSTGILPPGGRVRCHGAEGVLEQLLDGDEGSETLWFVPGDSLRLLAGGCSNQDEDSLC